MNFPTAEGAAGREFPFGSRYLPQVLSRLIRYLFYLMQISSLLSFLNSRVLELGHDDKRMLLQLTTVTQTQKEILLKIQHANVTSFKKTSKIGPFNRCIDKNKVSQILGPQEGVGK